MKRNSASAPRLLGYVIGFGLARSPDCDLVLCRGTNLVWEPSIPVALVVLAIAQMGVHLVFFLHITTGPDNTNNVMALAFGLLIVFLVIGGSLWIMATSEPEHAADGSDHADAAIEHDSDPQGRVSAKWALVFR